MHLPHQYPTDQIFTVSRHPEIVLHYQTVSALCQDCYQLVLVKHSSIQKSSGIMRNYIILNFSVIRGVFCRLLKWSSQQAKILACSSNFSESVCFIVSFIFWMPSKLIRIYSYRVIFLGDRYVWGSVLQVILSQARRMTLRLSQKIFMPTNKNSIALLTAQCIFVPDNCILKYWKNLK